MSQTSNRGRPRTRIVGSSPPEERIDSSPSRPRTKRRRIIERDPVQPPSPTTAQDQADAVIAALAIPDNGNVAVAKQYANDKNPGHGIAAFAKLSGANWTYYIRELVVRIGRPPDNRPGTGAGSPTPPPATEVIDIDLGPSKLISRNHALITYGAEGTHNWQINVLGRNGVKVDDESFKKDAIVNLRSGSVLEIGGVQMMFVLPNKHPAIAPSVLRRIRMHHFVQEPEELPLPSIGNDTLSYEPPPSPTPRTSSQHFPPPVQESSQASHARKMSNAGMQSGPAYTRTLLLDSPEDVDYSQDSQKETKPPFSYALLIAQAILSAETEQLTLASIYQFIVDKYAFYRHSNIGWQNSIRHNLSLNKAFRKIPRRTDEPGKGMKWELLPEHREEYIKKLRKPTKPRNNSSQPSSPNFHAIQTPRRLEDAPDLRISLKRPSRSVTPPPINSYRVQPLEAYTPDRGSRLPALRSNDKPLSETPGALARGAATARTHLAAPGGPEAPALSPGPAYDDNHTATAVTPAPQRQHPRLAPPSTGQLPSSYLPTSSPAPFWKFVQFGSTPAKPDGLSPFKDLNSSSPPPMQMGPDTGSRLRDLGSPLKERGGGFHLSGPRGALNLKHEAKEDLHDEDEDDDEDEDEDEEGLGDFPGIDLTRGFEKIGKFHVNGKVPSNRWA